MNNSKSTIFIGLLNYLNPFRKVFGCKEAVVYCSRRQGPTGLWEKLPELHYCLFNRGNEHLLKTDVEQQVAKIDVTKKSLVLVTDDAQVSIEGFTLGELVSALKLEYNILVIYIHENLGSIQFWKDVVTAGPLGRGDLGAIIEQEIKCLRQLSEVECIIGLSLECGEVFSDIWKLGIPILHYIPEFLSTPRQVERIKKSSRDATMQFFSSQEMKKKAVSLCGLKDKKRIRVFDAESPSKIYIQIKELISETRSILAKEIEDYAEIKSGDCFESNYAYPQIEVSSTRPYRDYLAAWRSGLETRKPQPGFHPGVYRDYHPDVEGDPTIDFIRQGKPAGPWRTEVMGEGNRESENEREATHLEWARWTATQSQPVKMGLQKCEFSGLYRVNMKGKGDATPLRAALHLHLHYTEGVMELMGKIKNSKSKPDLFISTTSNEGKMKLQLMLSTYGLRVQQISIFPNRGRDIGPFLTGFGRRLFNDYDIVGHYHSKKSPHAHDNYLQNWVEFLKMGLVGKDGVMMDAILTKMKADPSIGIIYPDDPGCFGWDRNYSYGKQLLEKMGLKAPNQDASMNFPVGTMFWARTAALKPLIDLNLKWEDYPEEPISIDGSMLHAMERVFGILPSLTGYRTVVSAVKKSYR